MQAKGGFRVTYLGAAGIGEPMETTATDRTDDRKRDLRVGANSSGFDRAAFGPGGIHVLPHQLSLETGARRL